MMQPFSAMKRKVYSPAHCGRDAVSSPELAGDPVPAPSWCELLMEAPAVSQGFKQTLKWQSKTLHSELTKPS